MIYWIKIILIISLTKYFVAWHSNIIVVARLYYFTSLEHTFKGTFPHTFCSETAVGMLLFCCHMPQPPQLQFSSVQCKTKYNTCVTFNQCSNNQRLYYTIKVILVDYTFLFIAFNKLNMKCNKQVPPFGGFLSGTSHSLKNAMKSMDGPHYERSKRRVCVCVTSQGDVM